MAIGACAALLTVSAGAAQQAAPTAAISGVVTDASTKRPLPGVTVSLGVDRRVSSSLRPPPVSLTITDEKGRFVFWPLEAGAGYFVNASAFGYFDGGYGRDGSSDLGRRITLADRQWFERADIEMRRPGAIAGRVLDEHGDPVVGVMVRVMRQIHVAGRLQIASGPNVTTDDRGAYRFAGLHPGRYLIVVPSTQMSAPASALAPLISKLAQSAPSTISPPTTADPMLDIDGAHRLVVGRFAVPPSSQNGRLMAYPVMWYPGTPSVNSAMVIDLQQGSDRSGVDIRLQPMPAARVSGSVQGPADVVSTLTLRLLPSGSEGLGLGSEAATALVAADGSFTFLNVPAGEYTIDARATLAEYEFDAGGARYNLPLPPGATSTGSSAMSLSTGTPGAGMATLSFGSDRHWGRLQVAVGERDITNLVVTLYPTVTLRGRLVFEGQSQPPGLRPFIIAEPATGDPSLGQPRNSNWSSDSPEFLIEGLLPGEYFLRVRGFSGWAVKSIAAGGRDYTNSPFDAAGGRDFTDVVVTLTDRPAAIEGTVSGPNGRLAASGSVIAFPVERHLWSNYGITPHRIKVTPLTNVSGYRISDLPAGEYLVVAVDESAAGMWHDPAFFEVAAASASRVALAWGSTSTQNLRIVEVRTR